MVSIAAGIGARYYIERIDAAEAPLAFDLNPACHASADCMVLVCGERAFIVGSSISFDSVQKIQNAWCEGAQIAGRQGEAACGSYNYCILGNSGSASDTEAVSADARVTLTDLEISGVTVYPNIRSARVEWKTNIPTNARIFVSGGGLSEKSFPSASSLSMKHSAEATELASDTFYTYSIQASSQRGAAVKWTGEFKTLVPLR